MKKYILPTLHLILLLASLLSPLWIDWKVVLIGYILYILQKILLKGCVLSYAEFGKSGSGPKQHFTPYYLKKYFGIKAEDYIVMRYLDYVIAPVVPILAFVIQYVFNYQH
jgi:hypothetical protein